jgi:hypothetical protein
LPKKLKEKPTFNRKGNKKTKKKEQPMVSNLKEMNSQYLAF